MLKVQEIREIIRLIDQSSISEFTYEHDGSKIKLKKSTNTVTEQVVVPEQHVVEVVEKKEDAPVVAEAKPQVEAVPQQEEKEEAPVVSDDDSVVEIVSPMVGTFYRKPSPEADPYVQVGDKIKESTIVCIVEAMKLFNEIEAEVEGEIVEVLVEDGELVEYGQPLFKVKTD